MPGGTLGNLDEQKFFRALASAAEEGDFFVVGVDTIAPEDDSETVKTTLRQKYRNPAIKSFVAAPLRAAWHDLKMRDSLEKVLGGIRVDVVDGFGNHSQIEGSLTVEMSLKVEGDNGEKREIVLVTSTRYHEKHLLDFAERYGFHALHILPSPLNDHYKQIIFRFVGI